MSEKLCLKWNDFQENINSAFGSLRKDSDFSDVTLSCEDGQQIEAHKVILSVSSPLFKNLLKRASKHSHPLIYMRGMKYEDLTAIVDFLYYGEANVFQENLDAFLVIAAELKLKGLTGQNIEEEEDHDVAKSTQPNPVQIKPQKIVEKDQPNPDTNHEQFVMKDQPPSSNRDISSNNKSLAIPNFVSGDLQELDEKVKSMMEKSQNLAPSGKSKAHICKVCGKEGAGIAIRDHIETNHLEGVCLPCNMCGKTFRSRWSLRRHKCI